MNRNGNRNRPNSPAFNVCLPFHHVIMVQMNVAFRNLLDDFFSDMCDDETPQAISAFHEALNDPAVYVHSKQFHKPTFLVCERYMGVIAIQMNSAMRDLLCDFINNVEGAEEEIVAFNLALGNPHASLEIRLEKLRDEISKRYNQGMDAAEIASTLRLNESVIGCFLWEIDKANETAEEPQEEQDCEVRRRKLTMA